MNEMHLRRVMNEMQMNQMQMNEMHLRRVMDEMQMKPDRTMPASQDDG